MEGFRTKKSLGQNFLASQAHIRAIADAGELTKGEWVLEVGPGKGTLTKELLSRGTRVVAVEKDDRLIPYLKDIFRDDIGNGHLNIVHADILKTGARSLGLPNRGFKAVANIPYYITGAFLRQILSGENQPSRAVLLVQKEVAERAARSTKESLLSLSLKAYGTPRYIRTVPRGAFSPSPSVDSAVLVIEHISRDNFVNARHEKRFFELLKAGFAQKRKYLIRNLEPLSSQETLEGAFRTLSVDVRSRAEDIPLSVWLALARTL